MIQLDPLVKEMLDRELPEPREQTPDWADVLRRVDVAAREAQTPRPRRRRVWYAVAAAAVVTALVGTPAFGLGGRIADWFRGSPAPEHVKEGLGGMNTPEEVRSLFAGPGVRADDARGVVALETEHGTAYLWAAPTDRGAWCTYVQLPDVPTGDGFAASSSMTCPEQPVDPETVELGVELEPFGAGSASILSGVAGSRVASLDLAFRDGDTVPVPLVDGFFLFQPPRVAPATLVARSQDGAVLQRFPVEPQAQRPPRMPPFAGRRIMSLDTPAGRVTLIARKGEGAYAGPGCYLVTGDGGEAEECRQRGDDIGFMFTQWGGFPGSEGLAVLLFGQVSPRVATLELELGDGTRDRIRLVQGYFLYDLDATHWNDARPWLVARDREGRRVARERVVRSGL